MVYGGDGWMDGWDGGGPRFGLHVRWANGMRAKELEFFFNLRFGIKFAMF